MQAEIKIDSSACVEISIGEQFSSIDHLLLLLQLTTASILIGIPKMESALEKPRSKSARQIKLSWIHLGFLETSPGMYRHVSYGNPTPICNWNREFIDSSGPHWPYSNAPALSR